MTQPGLLAHLSARFTHSEEDLATESLVFLLRTCPAAVAGLRASVHELGVDLPGDLVFHSQVGDPQTGRPDLVATDDAGDERLIIEAKFWANLTSSQPGAYLTRLAPTQPSLLLVVAPQVRLATLWTDLLTNLNAAGTRPAITGVPMVAPAPSDVSPAAGRYVLRLSSLHLLALVSWRAVLDAVDERLIAAGEVARAADLAQLRTLTERMDQRAFIPLRAEDLNTRTGRQVHSAALLVDRLRDGSTTMTRWRGKGRTLPMAECSMDGGYVPDSVRKGCGSGSTRGPGLSTAARPSGYTSRPMLIPAGLCRCCARP